jgi:hypothetical protein
VPDQLVLKRANPVKPGLDQFLYRSSTNERDILPDIKGTKICDAKSSRRQKAQCCPLEPILHTQNKFTTQYKNLTLKESDERFSGT